MKEEECMFSNYLKFIFCNYSYIFVCYFIHHDKLSIFTPVFKYVPVQVLNIKGMEIQICSACP